MACERAAWEKLMGEFGLLRWYACSKQVKHSWKMKSEPVMWLELRHGKGGVRSVLAVVLHNAA